MSHAGASELLVRARSALLDAVDALEDHRDALIVIGAQAIYLHTGEAAVGLAEATKDSDVAIDPRRLGDTPRIDDAMADGGFRLDPRSLQPGAWLNADEIPVDLMVPEMLAGGPGRRGVNIPPHSRHAGRRAVGLEAAVVDHAPKLVPALDPGDDRAYTLNVAGPAALLVAKLHKVAERREQHGRAVDKDAHDIYRLLVAIPTEELTDRLNALAVDHLAGPTTRRALELLWDLFAADPTAPGITMAGRAEALVGDPSTVVASGAVLAQDVLDAVRTPDVEQPSPTTRRRPT